MRIAVISDTHLNRPDSWLQNLYDRYLAEADVLLHCGDFTGQGVLETLQLHPRFYGVCGNCDGWEMTQELPEAFVVDLDGLRVGLVHGYGFPHPLGSSIAKAFTGRADLVCYGHTHVFADEEYAGIRTVNPGSARHSRKGPCSLAFIEYTRASPLEVVHVILD